MKKAKNDLPCCKYVEFDNKILFEFIAIETDPKSLSDDEQIKLTFQEINNLEFKNEVKITVSKTFFKYQKNMWDSIQKGKSLNIKEIRCIQFYPLGS